MPQVNLFGEPAPEDHLFEIANGNYVTASALEKADPEKQKHVMKRWFFQNYEDPVHSCPHDSAEGGYQFVYGGPFDAHEELDGMFGAIVSDEVINDLVDELENECVDWSRNSDLVAFDDTDEWDYSPSIELPKHLQTFKDSIANVNALLGVGVEAAQQRHFRGMLYVSVIMALEAYLLDNFLFCLDADASVFRKFIETTEEFRKQKIPLNTIFKESEGISKRGRSFLTRLLWHRLGQVARLYRDTLGVHFPQDVKELLDAVQIRHDIVHRNGRTADGKELNLSPEEVRRLIEIVEALVQGIEGQQAKLFEKFKSPNQAGNDASASSV